MVPTSYIPYTDWSACNWTANNVNTDNQLNVGSVSSPGECIALVQTYCPDAEIANIDKDGDGDCYCQYLASTDDDSYLRDTGGRRQSCLLSTVDDFRVNCYLGSSAVTCSTGEYLDDADLVTYLRHLTNYDTPPLGPDGHFDDAAPPLDGFVIDALTPDVYSSGGRAADDADAGAAATATASEEQR